MQTLLKKILISFVLLFTSISLLAAQKHECKEIIKTNVETREFITGKVSYGELKQQVVQQALLDAVKQTLGTEVRTHSGMTLKSTDGVESERFKDLTVEKAKGFVKSYKITREDIVDKGAITLLEISIDADICVPKRSEVKEMVVIGDFIADEKKSTNLRKVMMTGFPSKNKYYTLVSGSPDNVYHDIKIEGRLVEGSVTKETQQDAQKRVDNSKSNMKLLGKLFKNKNMEKYAYQKVERQKILNVEVIVEALMVADQELLSETVTLSKSIPINSSHESQLNKLIRGATKSASKKLFKKLITKINDEKNNSADQAEVDLRGF